MVEESEFEYTIKILIVGDSNVGKTNFMLRFTENKFIQNYIATTGIDLKSSNINLEGKKIRVQIWDTVGQEKYRSITKNLFLKVQGVLALYDITNEDSFVSLKSWVKLIKEECGNHMPMLIVGNKSDLVKNRSVEKDVAIAYAKDEKIEYIETSTKLGDNINEAILLIAEKILENSEFGNDCSFTLDVSSLNGKNKHKCCGKN
jgi:small GTP-binding protein